MTYIGISNFLAIFSTKLINKDKHKRAGISNMTYFVLLSYIYPRPIRLGTQALNVDPFLNTIPKPTLLFR